MLLTGNYEVAVEKDGRACEKEKDHDSDGRNTIQPQFTEYLGPESSFAYAPSEHKRAVLNS